MKFKHQKHLKAKNRHFQLLEVMVAIFILMICVGPAMQIFTNIHLQQLAVIRVNQRDHLAHRVQAYLTEKLYQRSIGFDQILSREMTALQDPELKKALEKIGYRAFYYFDQVDKKKSKSKIEKPDMYLVALVVILQDSNLSQNENSKNAPIDMQYYRHIYIDAPEGKANLDAPIDEDKIQGEQEEAELIDQQAPDASTALNEPQKQMRKN